MPAYNHQRFVGEAIDNVIAQTFEDWELIIIDDGSTDDTADVIKAYSDPRVQYYFQQNQDAFNALNNGIAKARGEFLAILNSDDVYLPERFEKLFAIQNETGADCLFTDVIPIDDSSRPLTDPAFGWNQWHQHNRQVFFDVNDELTAFLHGNYMVTTSNLFLRRSLANEVGPFAPIRYLHDYDYIFRVMHAAPGKTKYVHDEQLLKYRIHGGNTLSEAAITGREQDQDLIRRNTLALVPEAHRLAVETGINRLLTLQTEMRDVKHQLAAAKAQQQSRSANVASPSLLTRVVGKLKRSLGAG